MVLLSFVGQLVWVQKKEKFIERQDLSSAWVISLLWPVLLILLVFHLVSQIKKS